MRRLSLAVLLLSLSLSAPALAQDEVVEVVDAGVAEVLDGGLEPVALPNVPQTRYVERPAELGTLLWNGLQAVARGQTSAWPFVIFGLLLGLLLAFNYVLLPRLPDGAVTNVLRSPVAMFLLAFVMLSFEGTLDALSAGRDPWGALFVGFNGALTVVYGRAKAGPANAVDALLGKPTRS